MIRFILKNRIRDADTGLTFEQFQTIETDCPELEEVLRYRSLGTRSGDDHLAGYYVSELVGVELLMPDQAKAQPDEGAAIEMLNLSVRTENLLKGVDIHTIGTLLSRTPNQVLAIPGLGRNCFTELCDKLMAHGLSLKAQA